MEKSKTIILSIAAIVAVIAIIFSSSFKVSDDTPNKEEPKTEEKQRENFKIELEKSKCNAKWKTIYTYEDDKKIKSKCGEVYYIGEETGKMGLGEAISKEYVTISDITDNMEQIWGTFDGGSVLFEYNKDKQTIADSSFHLEICRKISGSKDQLFISSKDKEYYCN